MSEGATKNRNDILNAVASHTHEISEGNQLQAVVNAKLHQMVNSMEFEMAYL